MLSTRRLATLIVSSLGIAALAVGCGGEMPDELLSLDQQAACSNTEGVHSAMAALAVATARELGRWQPMIDFEIKGNMLQLTSAGKKRCADKVCANTQGILDMQKPEASGVEFPGGTKLVPDALRSRLLSHYERQKVCNQRVDNHRGDNCPTEKHNLKFTKAVPGSCDVDFWFEATKEDSSSALQYPAQLKNQLIWVGYPRNEYLAFDSKGDSVKVDPTGGLCEGYASSSGSCMNACTKFSSRSVDGSCCYCNGRNGKYARSPFSAHFYLCR